MTLRLMADSDTKTAKCKCESFMASRGRRQEGLSFRWFIQRRRERERRGGGRRDADVVPSDLP